MSAGKNQYVPSCSADACYDTVRPATDLLCRFPSRAAVAKQSPAGTFVVNLSGGPALVIAVVPFDEIVIEFSLRSEPGQVTGPRDALQRTGKDFGEGDPAHPSLELPRIALAARRQRNIRTPRMLARERPGRFAMPREINSRKCFAH